MKMDGSSSSIETRTADDALQAYQLNKWQRCLFQLSTQNPPREKADAVRGIISQLHCASLCDKLPNDFVDVLKSRYMGLYSSIIDCSNPETGLNNYADGALALSSHSVNDSANWTSSLSRDSLKSCADVRNFKAESEISLKNRKKDLREASQSLLNATLSPAQPTSSNRQPQHYPSVSKTVAVNGPSKNTTISANLYPVSMQTSDGRVSDGGGVRKTQPSAGYQCHNPLFAKATGSYQSARPGSHSEEPLPIEGLRSNITPTGPSYSAPHHQRTFPTGGATRQGGPGEGVRGGVPQAGTPYLAPHHQRPFPTGGATRQRGPGGVGSAPGGYDPTSQMCNLGILGGGRPPPGATSGHPSLKRKFEASDSRVGPCGPRPSPFQSYQGPQQGPGGQRPRWPQQGGENGAGGVQGEARGGGGGEEAPVQGAFKTAKEQLSLNQQKKFGNRGGGSGPSAAGYGTGRKVLGVTRRGLNSKFVPPVQNKDEPDYPKSSGYRPPGRPGSGAGAGDQSGDSNPQEPVDERLQHIDPKMVELVMSEIMDHGPPIHWDDIAGLEFAKNTIKEIVVWPMLRPDIFTGLRGPPKGLLLFGPPGTGKTLIGKCIACQSGATFFSISASSLTSKWVGEGEKMVRALFAVARCYQPAVIFIDEIDSLLSQRSNDEHESSRRIKTEFLVQLDGATTSSDERLLIVGATNRPQEIDEAARRRLVKRLYIPLPEAGARKQIVCSLLSQQSSSLSEEELNDVCQCTEGYSGADMANLCREAALGPIRSIQGTDIQHISADQVRPILHGDLKEALQNVRPSVAQSDLDTYLEWNAKFGCGTAK